MENDFAMLLLLLIIPRRRCIGWCRRPDHAFEIRLERGVRRRYYALAGADWRTPETV